MRALFVLLLLLPAQALTAPASPLTFEKIVRQADEARAGDRLPDAIRLYREALKLRPSWSTGWWWLGSIYYDQDRFPEAQAAFSQFISTGKAVAPAYGLLGLCEYETRDYDHAAEHFRLWVQKGSPGTSQLIDVASFHFALLLTREGHFFEALYLLGKKVEKHGPDPALAEAMGLAWMRMKNIPEDYSPERREMVWLAGMASVYLSAQQLDRVHEFQDRLAAHYGDEPNVHYFRGYVYEFEKSYDQAASEYRQELKISPDHAAAMVQLALMDVEESKLEEGSALAQRAIVLEPKSPLAHYAMGRVLLGEEQWRDSAVQLEVARKLAPESAKVRFHLAIAYKNLGRLADAQRENAAFEALKDKKEVLASPQEKGKAIPESRAKTQ
jgi:tetratricopeptide (TPR) repeat protein